MKETITVFFSLVGVIIFILLTYYGARWLSKRVRIYNNGVIKVLERVNIGPDKAMMVVAVGEKYMLIGVTQQHIDKITELEKQDVEKLLEENKPSEKLTFSAQLVNAFLSRKQSGGGAKDDKS